MRLEVLTKRTVWQTNLPAAMTYGSLMPDLVPVPRLDPPPLVSMQ